MSDWDSVIRGFEGMYDMMKDRGTEGGKMWAGHASGMLQLIPRIRSFDEFKEIEFGGQLGKLVFHSKVKKAKMNVSFSAPRYYLFIYDINDFYLEVNYDSDQIVAAVHRYLKQITTP